MTKSLSAYGILAAVAVVAVTVPAGASAQDKAPEATADKPKSPDKLASDKTAPPKSTPETAEQGPVTITAKKSGATDKEVYDVSKDPDAATSVAADTLNKVPGVAVDTDGNVSVRGQAARLYLNGRPSLLLSGDNRAQALRSMPSAYMSSVEVISNPGAQYDSSGGPIVNIVTKRNMPAGAFGSVGGQLASTGGGTAFGFLSYVKDKLSLTASGSYNDSHNENMSRNETTVFDAAGTKLRDSVSSSRATSVYNGPSLMTNAQYDLGPNDVLTGTLSLRQGSSESEYASESTSKNAAGVATDVYASLGRNRNDNSNTTAGIGYVHYGQKPDQVLKLDLSLGRSDSSSISHNASTFTQSSVIGNSGTRYQRYENDNTTDNLILQADYTTTFGRTQVAGGAQVTIDETRASNLSFGPGTSEDALLPQTLLSSDFRSHQTISALYGTVQKEVGQKLTVLAGLRAEAVELRTEEARLGTEASIDYVRLNPSLFATYVVSQEKKVRFSYTHKQQRPMPSDLNPGRIYRSATSVTVGNEDLEPQDSDAIELAYEMTGKTVNWSVRGFYRFDDDTIISSSRTIPDPQNLGNLVIETTRLNWGHQTNSGVTLSYGKRIEKSLSFNADATVTLVELTRPQYDEPLTDTVFSGGASVSYRFKDESSVSLNLKLNPRRFTGQGYSDSYVYSSLSYRRKLTKKIDFNMTIQDPIKPQMVTITDTQRIRGRSVNERDTPVIYFGLSRSFGSFGQPKK